MGRICVFCGGTPVNQEHALPRWLGELFTDEVVDFSRTIQYRDREPEVRPWRGRPFGATVGGPCARCNGGWMSDLESQASPLLRSLVGGERATLNPVEQFLAATWAVKTMLMLRLISADNDDRELAPDMYHWIRAQRSPPSAEQVWIAAYAGEGQWPATFRYFGIAIGTPEDDAPPLPNAHASSFAVGHLAFGLAGHRIARGPSAVASLPPDAVRPIWPAYGQDVAFPPPAWLPGDSEMGSLAMPERWE